MKINKKFLAPFYPFAGFCVAWYCLMPNFTLLFSGGMYRSQLLIHANFLINDARYLWKKTTQPKTMKYKECKFNEMINFNSKRNEMALSIPIEERYKNEEYMALLKIDLPTYLEEKCGEPPREGT